jgi:hypothetical protein
MMANNYAPIVGSARISVTVLLEQQQLMRNAYSNGTLALILSY